MKTAGEREGPLEMGLLYNSLLPSKTLSLSHYAPCTNTFSLLVSSSLGQAREAKKGNVEADSPWL